MEADGYFSGLNLVFRLFRFGTSIEEDGEGGDGGYVHCFC